MTQRIIDLDLDLDEFKPEQKKIGEEAKAKVAELAEQSGFTGRHAPAAKPAKAKAAAPAKAEKAEVPQMPPATPVERESETGGGEVRRRGRKRTTGRDTPFTVKLRKETNNLIYDLADQMGCNAIAEVLEQALEALQEKIAEQEGGQGE